MSCSPSKPPTTLKDMWVEADNWAATNFPGQTFADVVAHLAKEVEEVEDARAERIAYWRDEKYYDYDDPDLAKQEEDRLDIKMVRELSDVMIIAGRLIHAIGYDPETEILGKWEEVRERTYIDGERVV